MKLTCNVVRDLVGVCTDCAASEETKKAVQEHLAQCPACARYYYDYERIGRIHRASGRRPAAEMEMDYRNLSERIRRKRNTDMAATAAAIFATACVTALVFVQVVKNK